MASAKQLAARKAFVAMRKGKGKGEEVKDTDTNTEKKCISKCKDKKDDIKESVLSHVRDFVKHMYYNDFDKAGKSLESAARGKMKDLIEKNKESA